MDRPLVSIVVLCHNRADRLPETLQSVFSQSYRPTEILVVDDGSTDGTPELIASYGDRVRYQWHENRGIAASRTVGGRLARGDYIAYQDDDDLMPPERIVILLDALKCYPQAVMATGDFEYIDAQSNLTGQRYRPALPMDQGPILFENGRRAVLWSRLSPLPHTTLFRKADGERIGWFDERFFHSCEDTDFFARCAALGPVVYVPEVVSLYRNTPGISNPSVLQAYSRFLLYEKHLTGGVGVDPLLDRRLQARLFEALLTLEGYARTGAEFPPAVDRHRIRRGTGLLRTRDRLRLGWATAVRRPLGGLVRRLGWRQGS